MSGTLHAWCSGCKRLEPVDRHWRVLTIGEANELIISSPTELTRADLDRDDHYYACGQASALRMAERFLHDSTEFERRPELAAQALA